MQDSESQVSIVKAVVELADKHYLAELTVKEGDLTVTVRRSSPVHAAVVHTGLPAVETTVEEYEEDIIDETIEEAADEGIYDIIAPLVGVFYRASSPDAPNFVEVGDTVEVSQEVGLIEAMKVFSPVPSEVAGVVVEIPAADGELVKQGDVLVRIRTTE